MTFRSTGSSASRAGIFAVVALLVQVIAVALHSATAAARDEPDANIIVTSDAPGVRQQGGFQQIETRLSHSQTPLRSVGAGAHSVTFTPSIAQPGFYRVFVWWPQVYDNVGAVDVAIKHLRGTSVVTTVQGARTGQWIPIGIYEFASAGAEVSLRGNPGDTLLADAVRFQYMGSAMPALAFETDALPVASTGETYSASFDLIAGSPPYAFAVDGQQLPPGMVLDSVTGTVTGTATTIGSYEFDMTVSDSTGQRAARIYTIDVVRGSSAAAGRVGIARDAAQMKPLDGVPAGTPPDLSNLITVLATLPAGEWYKANLNAFSDVWTSPDLRPLVGSGNPTPYKLIQAWSSFAWDPNRGQLWLYGGGHANYSGNDVYRWRAATQRWERASLPSEIKQDDLGNWQAIDGWDAAPGSAHTYDNNMFFPHIDRLVVFGGAAYNSGDAFRREVTTTTNRLTGPFFFDPARADGNKVGGTTGSHVMRVAPHPEIVGGNMWTNRDMYKNIAGGTFFTDLVDGCTAYADESGKDVAYIGGHVNGSSQLNLYKYTVNDLANPSLDTLQLAGIYWSGPGSQTACGVDPVRKLFVRIGATNITYPFDYWNLATPGPANKDVLVTPVDPTGEFGTLLSSGQIKMGLCSMDFDPTRARFVLWCGDGRVWALTPPPTTSPSGWTIVKQPSPSLAVPNGDVGTGLLGKWKYIPNLDAFIGLQDYTLGNIWIYKPVGWINPAGTSAGTTVVLQRGRNGYTGASDTFLDNYHRTLAEGGATVLYLEPVNYNPLIRFAIFQSEGGPVPNGSTILSATLAVYKQYYSDTIRLNALLKPWVESQATWTVRQTGVPWTVGGAAGAGTDYSTAADALVTTPSWNPGWVSFDVTPRVQQWASGGANYGWRMAQTTSAYNNKQFNSSEFNTDTTLRPKLTVVYH